MPFDLQTMKCMPTVLGWQWINPTLVPLCSQTNYTLRQYSTYRSLLCVWPTLICLHLKPSASARTLCIMSSDTLSLRQPPHTYYASWYYASISKMENAESPRMQLNLYISPSTTGTSTQAHNTQLLHSADIPLQILEDKKKFYQQWVTP